MYIGALVYIGLVKISSFGIISMYQTTRSFYALNDLCVRI